MVRYTGRIGGPLMAVGAIAGITTYFFGAEFIVAVFGAQFSVPQSVILPIAVSIFVLPLVYVSGVVLLVRNLYPVQLATGVITLVAVTTYGLTFDTFTIESAALLVLGGTCVRASLGIATALWSFRKRETRNVDEIEVI